MIRIGNQTSCWTATPGVPFEYALAQGFDAFEWFPDKKPEGGWDEADLDAPARQQIREHARAGGIRLSVHARWQADLLAPDSVEWIWNDLELARDLGAALLNVHLGHGQGIAAFVQVAVPLIRRTAEAGLQLAIENTPDHSPAQLNELFTCLRDLRSPDTRHVGMCLDLGHANLCAATRNDYLGFVDRLDPEVPIIHLHLHENWGDADTHLPLFTGPAAQNDAGIRGLVARLRRRQFSGSIILEQWPHPPSLLDNARNRLLQLWDSVGGGADEPPAPRKAPLEAASARSAEQPSPGVPGRDLVAELVEGDRRSRSWREKLDFVRGLLASDERPLTQDQLIDIAIYLRFLGTGEIPCAEDGRHFRPAHHARIASQIQERLARLTTPGNLFIVRKIYPWLPSSAPAFQRPEPLTRIRDIAHRNDIDPALKREIKTTLQNKLHRCAGPEDLATSAVLLKRITAPGAAYSPGFVAEFGTFHKELKEFFNARSLDDRLAALVPAVDADLGEPITRFLNQKSDASLPGQLGAFRTLTALRESFLAAVAQHPGLETQPLLLADIALDDFAFVLLSEISNAVENAAPAESWEVLTEVLPLALHNLALSGVEPAEVRAVEAELRAWRELSTSAARDDLLRVKASVLRSRRLAEDFGAHIAALFSGRAEKLGRALGVPDHAVRVFSESDIRAHNVFQVAKLGTSLLRQIRRRLGLAGWDVLVSGQASGRAKAVDSLEELERDLTEPVVALLKRAAGDEEIPKSVVGIVLAHEMPHLSHLGLRARQAQVVFAACEEPAEFERLRQLDGQAISLMALPDQVAWKVEAEVRLGAVEGRPAAPQILVARLHPALSWIPIEQAAVEIAGGKAAGVRRLTELSSQPGAGFATPPALVVPFGVMEAQLAAAPAVAAEYQRLVRRLEGMAPDELAAATQPLRNLVHRLAVPQAIVAEAARRFGRECRLAVRSSANCEDLADHAGAGLYDSLLGVALEDLASAICAVWSSLWTRRAALSRRQAGIAQDLAHMAVLVQEMVAPEYSFVLHTVNPVNRRADEIYAEIVVGLGDTLASATARGTPYRLACDKASGAVATLAFANFSQASLPATNGGARREIVDYSCVELSRDAVLREALGRRLAAVGRFVEIMLKSPQDIEGAVAGDRIFLVQTRPQPGLDPGHNV